MQKRHPNQYLQRHRIHYNNRPVLEALTYCYIELIKLGLEFELVTNGELEDNVLAILLATFKNIFLEDVCKTEVQTTVNHNGNRWYLIRYTHGNRDVPLVARTNSCQTFQ